jgi:recombination protein RecT
MARDLRERVHATRNPATPTNGGTDVEPADKSKALIAQVRQMQPQYELAMGRIRGAEADQLVRDVITQIRQQPDLADCAPETVLGGAMTFAQLGLRCGVKGLGHGWLIPMYNSRKRRMEAQQIIGYKGYVKLAYQAGPLRDLRARTIFQNDHWAVEYGTDERLLHRPSDTDDRGAPIGYYCVVNMRDGGQVFFHMSHAEMEHWRDLYAMAREMVWDPNLRRKVQKIGEDGRPVIVGPWRDNFEPMAWKTTWLRCVPWVPLSADLELATAADGTVRLDPNPTNRDAMVGDQPDPNIVDGDVVTTAADTAEPEPEPEREQVTVVGGGAPPAEPPAEERPAAADPEPPAGQPPEPPAEQAPEPAEPPRSGSGRFDRQATVRWLFAAMKRCGITGDVGVLVMVAALTDTPITAESAPGSLDAFSDEALANAAALLNGWRTGPDDDGDMCGLLLEHRPDPDSPAWDLVEQARRRHEDSKRPSARGSRSTPKKKETTDG